jgi:hypothetical protein
MLYNFSVYEVFVHESVERVVVHLVLELKAPTCAILNLMMLYCRMRSLNHASIDYPVAWSNTQSISVNGWPQAISFFPALQMHLSIILAFRSVTQSAAVHQNPQFYTFNCVLIVSLGWLVGESSYCDHPRTALRPLNNSITQSADAQHCCSVK